MFILFKSLLVKDKLVADLLAVKAKANVTFNSIAQTIGLTNVQTADIFFRQVSLSCPPSAACTILSTFTLPLIIHS